MTQYPYISLTEQEEREMLDVIGVDSIEDLFEDIPEEVSLKGNLNLPEAKSELEVSSYLRSLAKNNKSVNDLTCFMGTGAYDHYIPSVVGAITGRSEFYTSYTPYQPEVSQGTLQYIFEFQTLITRLTGLPVANASLYDRAYSIAEAAIMCTDTNRNKKVVISETVDPQGVETLKTYAHTLGIEVVVVPMKEDGMTDVDALEKEAEDAGCVVLQSPNVFGYIEPTDKVTEITKNQKKCSMVLVTDPTAMSILKRPGDFGVDVVVGDLQALGVPLAFGGPYVGFLACSDKFIRKFPGRVVGQTEDMDGKRSWVLTLSAREQHIRREKATSNICSNQGLNVLAATVYMATMGKQGMKEVAEQCIQKSHYCLDQLVATGKFKPLSDAGFVKEFAVVSDKTTEELNEKLRDAGFLGGFAANRFFPELDKNVTIIAVTEKRTKEEIDEFVRIMGEA